MPRTMDRRILMIAYHFPPIRGSSGLLRTLSFARHLPAHGWEPLVLAPHLRAYPRRGEDPREGIPDGLIVHRAFALDTRRHLALGGRYLRSMALPDPFVSWWLGGVYAGLRLVRRYRPAALWSTYPVATAQLIGATLQRFTGLPWVADFRDPMVYEGWPDVPSVRRAHERIERAVIRRSARLVLTTPGSRALYAERYPELPGERWALIPNGYDEAAFAGLTPAGPPGAGADRRLRLVHSGLMEPADRDPSALFAALAKLRGRGELGPAELQVVLRATGHDARYSEQIRRHGVEDMVSLAPHRPYREALQEMLDADGLLIFQGPNCNRQIPAKLYECLRAGRPLLALADPAGDTAAVLREDGLESSIVPFGDVEAIAAALPGFLAAVRAGSWPIAERGVAARHARERGADSLATLLDGVTGGA